MEVSYAQACAVDPDTGWVVVGGDDSVVEVFDAEAMSTVSRTVLEGVCLGYSLEISKGRAWLATMHGSIVEFDILSRSVVNTYDVGQDGQVRIDVSNDGRLLVAVSVSKSIDSQRMRWDAEAEVFSITPSGLESIDRIEIDLTSVPNDVSIWPNASRVLISGLPGATLEWKYRDSKYRER